MSLAGPAGMALWCWKLLDAGEGGLGQSIGWCRAEPENRLLDWLGVGQVLVATEMGGHLIGQAGTAVLLYGQLLPSEWPAEARRTVRATLLELRLVECRVLLFPCASVRLRVLSALAVVLTSFRLVLLFARLPVSFLQRVRFLEFVGVDGLLIEGVSERQASLPCWAQPAERGVPSGLPWALGKI